MSLEPQLRAAVLADPDDDTPRLIYADWIHEHGDPARSQLIRDQCAFARLPPWELQAKVLHRRIRGLLARHGRRWLPQLPHLDGVAWGAFHRGFVTQVGVAHGDVLSRHADAMRRAAPIERVLFWEPAFQGEAGIDDLTWIREVRLPGHAGFVDDHLRRLVGSPVGAGLRTLDLADVEMENAGVEIIASGHLPELRHLNLLNNFVGNAGLAALCRADHLRGLKQLCLASFGSGYVDDPFVSDLTPLLDEATALAGLEELHLGGHSIDNDALKGILSAPHLRRLHTLGLTYGRFTPAAFDAPPREDLRLRSLDLYYVNLDPEAVGRLATLPQTASIARLYLTAIELPGPESIAALAPLAPGLRELHLSDYELGREGVAALATQTWPALHTLTLPGNALDGEAIRILSETALPCLDTLVLDDNPIGPGGAQHLARAPFAPTLRDLSLVRCEIGGEGMAALADAPALSGIGQLDVSDNGLPTTAVADIGRGPWHGLTDLEMAHTPVGESATSLARAPFTDTLIALDLTRCGLTEDGLANLLATTWPQLCHLDLCNSIGLGTAEPLTPEALPALRSLGLASCGITDLAPLLQRPIVARLASMKAYGNPIPHDLFREIRVLHDRSLAPDWLPPRHDESVLDR